jgi:hypothetical protein
MQLQIIQRKEIAFGILYIMYKTEHTARPKLIDELWKIEVTKDSGTGMTYVYPKVSGLAAWSENCKRYSSLPLSAAV